MPRRPSDQHIDNPAAVGRRLRQTRTEVGLSQRALAFPGCTPAYISRIEAGQRIPSLQLLRELANRIGVDVEYLARGDEASAAVTDPLAEAELDLRLGDVEAAERHFSAVAGAEVSDRERARAVAGLGQIAFGRGDSNGAIEAFEQALELSPRLEGDDPALADSLGRAYAMTSQYDRAVALFERRYNKAQQRQDLIQTTRFAVLLANTLVDSGSFARAEELLGKALAQIGDEGDPLTNARLWWTQSRLHTLQNEPTLAERYARLALDTLMLTEHTRYVALARQVLAHIYLDEGRADEALEVLEPARATLEASENAYDRGVIRVELARALVEVGRTDEAMPLAQTAADELREVSPIDAGRAHDVLAGALRRRGDVDGAIAASQRALTLLPVNDRYRLAVSSSLAEMLREQGRNDEALDVLAEAVRSQAGERQLS
ncbi:MAG TPA: tetratricopeptide repeat protein [Gaiellaceae bacterium]|nr:tetratricopeptide repeat protein [Gaiellaceae bacterium]